jgi:WD40 repeat protein/serine/threonine protein kinase
MGAATSDFDTIFCAAIALSSDQERAAYIAAACGSDGHLRERVERLVNAHFRAGSFMEMPAVGADSPIVRGDQDLGGATSAHVALRETAGAVIGPYKLLEQIGEGGFGIVFMAEQLQPVRRKVAFKVLKPGMDTRQVVARFEAERQALALMDHPNIAHVFDGGETQAGRPYFVMELVRGIPITEFCDQNRVPVRERLELFTTVCQAVQHAHQKGIIHRDLKPSNIMVTMHDDRPVVKVIDFGIAKATGRQLTDKTLFTNFAQMIGTPMYMSPEQAQMSGLDVDTRSDIYSLGVLLYELLTGSTPFDQDRLKAATYDEIRRIIREEEPARPSTRISTLGMAASTVSVNRRCDPKRLSQLYRGELDWIVMKALEKDRTRRYETVGAFAADLQRYLKDEPVQACPPSAWYRFRKFARRNRTGLGIAAALGLLMLLAVVLLAVNNAAIAQQREQTRQALDGEVAARKELATTLERERQTSYFYRIELADQEWVGGNVAGAEQHLDQCPADLRHFEWYYLKRLCHTDMLTLRGHQGGLLCLALSADGKRLVSGGLDRNVKVWDVATGQELLSLEGHNVLPASAVACSPDGRLIAAAHIVVAKVWEAATGREIFSLPTTGCHALAFTPESRFLVVADWNHLKVLDPKTGKMEYTLGPAGDPLKPWAHHIQSIAVSPNGRWLASGDSSWVRLWDLAKRKETHALSGHTDQVTSVAFSSDSKSLVSGSKDATVKVWDVALGQGRLSWTLHSKPVTRVAISPDGGRLASASEDMTIKCWDTATARNQVTLRGHTSIIHGLAFDPLGKTLATASFDKTIKLWDPSAPQEARILRTCGGTTGPGVIVSPDGQCLANAYADGSVKLWDALSGRERFRLPAGKVTEMAFSPDGLCLVSCNDRHLVTAWSVVTGEAIFDQKMQGELAAIAVSCRGQRLAVLTRDSVWHVRAGRTGQEILAKKSQGYGYAGLAFSPADQRFALRAPDGTVTMYDEAGRELVTLAGAIKDTFTMVFSCDGRQIASANVLDQSVKVWDTWTGEELWSLRRKRGIIYRDEVMGLAFSPDGKRLAAASRHENLTLWELASGREVLALRGYAGCRSLAFSVTGQVLICSTWDTKVRIWDGTPLGADPGQAAGPNP